MYLTHEQIENTAHLTSRQAARELGVGKTSINKYRNLYNVLGADDKSEPKILVLDIESKPMKAYVWGPRVDWIPAGQIISHGGLLCFAAKWLGSEEVIFHKGASAVKEIHKLLSEADVVVTYNGDRYDLKRLNNEFLLAGMAPPKPYKSIDLIKVNRAKFDLPYRSLDYMAQRTGLGEKEKHQGFDLWVDCERGVPEAWEVMESYNKKDVLLTESLYIKLLPWLGVSPHIGMLAGKSESCPYCGSTDLADEGESTWTYVQSYQLYRCEVCEGWSRGVQPLSPKVATRRAG